MWHSHLNVWKFLKQKVLFPKGLNWVEHFVSQIGVLSLVLWSILNSVLLANQIEFLDVFWWCHGKMNNILYFLKLVTSSLKERSLPCINWFGKRCYAGLIERMDYGNFSPDHSARYTRVQFLHRLYLESKSRLAQNQNQKSHEKDKTRHFLIFYFTGWRTDLFSIEFCPR